jgi:hypothetical protein
MAQPLATVSLLSLTSIKQAMLDQQEPLDHQVHQDLLVLQVLLGQLEIQDQQEPLDYRVLRETLDRQGL